MIHYGISMVHIDGKSGEIAEVRLHQFLKRENDPVPYELDDGKKVLHVDVASLIIFNNTIWVLETDDQGKCMMTDRVRLKPGQMNYIESCDPEGKGTTRLLDLPHY